MVDGINYECLDELIDYINSLEISEQLESKALRAGGEVLLEAVKDATPVKEGFMKKSWKGGIKRVDGEKVYSVRNYSWDILFASLGSSKNKKYVGFDERAIDGNLEKAYEAMLETIMEVF